MPKMNDKERVELAATLEKYDDEELKEIREVLVCLRDGLKDANSAFPETKIFLEARGLTHVNQLDGRGMKELEEHLRGVLAKLTN